MKILITGDMVGGPGRRAFVEIASKMKKDGEVDFIVANAENAAGGRGITAALAKELFSAGADVITMGDHTWDQKELVSHIATEPRILRPINFAPASPGKGWITLETPKAKITVINAVGRVFMPPHFDCPFRAIDSLLNSGEDLGRIILVDMHAEATSEKIAMGRFLDGRATSVTGTHTHVQTADECILPKGTAYITDLGMTGPKDSILGRDVDSIVQRFITGMPTQFKVANKNVCLEGVVIEADELTGRAVSVKRIQMPATEVPEKSTPQGNK